MAVEKILLQFEADIKDLKSELGEVKSQLGNVEKQTEQTGSKITNTFKNVGKAIAGAFAIREVVRFGQEAIKLAATFEGVEAAFKRIATPGLLDELRKATKGTVSDLQLMQNAVRASNFQIPLEQLAKLFSFAQQRARETGESVDYLVESITLGIARKSIPILDNLGLSSVQVQEEFAKTGDMAVAVGNIIDKSMTGAADFTTEAADAADRAKANFENLKVAIGQQLLPALTALRTGFADSLEWIGRNFGLIREEISLTTEEQIKQLDVSVKEVDGLKSLVDRYDELSKEVNLTSEQKSEMSRITTQLTSEFGSSAIAINSETGAYELNREAILKQIQTRALLNSNEAQALLMKRAQLQLEIDRGKAVYDINEALLANNQLQGQALVDFEVSQAAYKAAKDELALLDEQLRKIGLDLESIVIPAFSGADGNGGLNRAVLDLSESLDKLPKIVQDLYDPFAVLPDAVERFGQAMVRIFGENEDPNKAVTDFYDNLEKSIKSADDANIEFFENLEEKRQEDQDSQDQWLNNLINGLEAAQKLFGSYGQLLIEIGGKQSALAEFGRQLAFFEIATAQAVATANAVKLVSTSAKTPIDYFVFLASILSSVAVNIGKARSLIEKDSVPQFATGVVDLKGAGTETSDSIHAKLSRGESVITAKGTRQDKGLFEAANKLQLEKYINENYVLPALIKVNKERSAMFDDYRLYRELRNSQGNENKNFDRLIRTINRKKTRYDWN